MSQFVAEHKILLHPKLAPYLEHIFSEHKKPAPNKPTPYLERIFMEHKKAAPKKAAPRNNNQNLTNLFE
jgi:hypothetical protein